MPEPRRRPVAETSEYRCDGCGRTTIKKEAFDPRGWYR